MRLGELGVFLHELLQDRLLREIYDDPNVRSQRVGDQTLVWVDL